MQGFTLTDLDADPELSTEVLRLFRGCPPGHNHAVCGMPSRMGREPTQADFDESLGVLVLHRERRVVGALALCPYSDEQVTLWGPVIHRAFIRMGIGSHLIDEARRALADGGYESLRVNVDSRNRDARSFLLTRGLSAWKDNLIYERNLYGDLPPDPGGVSLARSGDHEDVATILKEGFPDSNHTDRPLARRERQGFRHHLLQDSGTIVGAAAVKVTPGRSWLSMIAVSRDHRGQGYGHRLLAGLLHQEAAHGATRLGLEVLADNPAAIALYERAGFHRAWSATIMTGPV